MNSAKGDKAQLRAPMQKRSIERVNQILDATRQLILERGSAGLKIQDIAKRAGVTAGSMYQYFPNKAAIIQELGQRYLDQTAEMIEQQLTPPPQSVAEFRQAVDGMIDAYCELHQRDPVIQDLFLGAGADKSLRSIDEADTKRNAQTIYAATEHLFDPATAPQAIFLILNLTNTAVRVAMDQPASEAAVSLRVFKRMVGSVLDDLTVN